MEKTWENCHVGRYPFSNVPWLLYAKEKCAKKQGFAPCIREELLDLPHQGRPGPLRQSVNACSNAFDSLPVAWHTCIYMWHMSIASKQVLLAYHWIDEYCSQNFQHQSIIASAFWEVPCDLQAIEAVPEWLLWGPARSGHSCHCQLQGPQGSAGWGGSTVRSEASKPTNKLAAPM